MVTGSANGCLIASRILEDISGSSVLARLSERPAFVTWQPDQSLDSVADYLFSESATSRFEIMGILVSCPDPP